MVWLFEVKLLIELPSRLLNLGGWMLIGSVGMLTRVCGPGDSFVTTRGLFDSDSDSTGDRTDLDGS